MWIIWILSLIIVFVSGLFVGKILNTNKQPVTVVDPLVAKINRLSPNSYRYVDGIADARGVRDAREKHQLYFKPVDGE